VGGSKLRAGSAASRRRAQKEGGGGEEMKSEGKEAGAYDTGVVLDIFKS
jgi:hypothetical protein